MNTIMISLYFYVCTMYILFKDFKHYINKTYGLLLTVVFFSAFLVLFGGTNKEVFAADTAIDYSPKLEALYERVDEILVNYPEKKMLFIEKLEEILPRFVSVTRDYAVVVGIVNHIRENYKESLPSVNERGKSMIGSLLGISIPQGFGSLSKEHLLTINEDFYFEGGENTPIWVIEFIDFQCPYCQRQHKSGVLDILEYEKYVGTVRSGVGMFPLTGKWHELAGEAAENANELH